MPWRAPCSRGPSLVLSTGPSTHRTRGVGDAGVTHPRSTTFFAARAPRQCSEPRPDRAQGPGVGGARVWDVAAPQRKRQRRKHSQLSAGGLADQMATPTEILQKGLHAQILSQHILHLRIFTVAHFPNSCTGRFCALAELDGHTSCMTSWRAGNRLGKSSRPPVRSAPLS